jgi:uncharacterized protein YndB with AHSA1/START domain
MPDTNFAYPAGEPISIITHTFDAPRAVVWKATTDPKHVVNWWGPRGVTTKIVKLDLRPGGTWRFEHHMPDGSVYIFKGTYLEIVAPERLVQTFGMEGMYEDQLIVETATYEEQGGKTKLTVVSRFDSIEARDGMRASGMEGGARESYERLDEVLKTL